jgi:hypothetical protein
MHNVIKRLIWGEIPFRKVQLGNLTSDYVGFYGTAPIVQPTHSTQTSIAITAITAAATTAPGTCSGVDYVMVIATLNSLITRVSNTVTLANRMRTDLIALGLIKGT